jgi:hypothetical protein
MRPIIEQYSGHWACLPHPPVFSDRAEEEAPAFLAGRCRKVVLFGACSITLNAISSIPLLFLQHTSGTRCRERLKISGGAISSAKPWRFNSHLAERLRLADDRNRAERTAPAHRRLQEEEID